MKKQGLILGLAVILTQGLYAQVTLNNKGLYQENGALFSGVLETKQNGHKAVLEIKDGTPEGDARYYYESGKLMEKGTFSAGLKNNTWTRYNESGVTVGLAVFNRGKKDGTWMVWNDEGKKLFEMHYHNGEKTGTWYNWDASGQLISSKDFSHAN
jgi:antitoxin component YwqK of YwqJK toxin-antitoxin module